MTNQEKLFPQTQKPLCSQQDFHPLDEAQLEAATGGGGLFSKSQSQKVHPLPGELIRTLSGNLGGMVTTANLWASDHPTPEARENPTWLPKLVKVNSEWVWVKVPRK